MTNVSFNSNIKWEFPDGISSNFYYFLTKKKIFRESEVLGIVYRILVKCLIHFKYAQHLKVLFVE